MPHAAERSTVIPHSHFANLDRKKHLYLLLRRNAGRLLFPEFAERLGAATGRTVTYDEFLPLPTSDSIRSVFADRLEAEEDKAPSLLAEWHDAEKMESDLAALAASLGTVFLFFDVSDRVGALPIDAADLFRSAASFLEVSNGHLAISDRTGENSLSLSFDDDWHTNYPPYEALVSGALWVVASAPFLRAV